MFFSILKTELEKQCLFVIYTVSFFFFNFFIFMANVSVGLSLLNIIIPEYCSFLIKMG